MSAEIKTTMVSSSKTHNFRKPELIYKLDGINDTINMAIFTPRENGVISISDDRTIRVWLKRDSGMYWPSIYQTMPAAVTSVYISKEIQRLFVGLENGTISEYELSEDYNKLIHIREYLAHQNQVTWVHYSLSQSWLLSTSKDKYFQWHCSKTGRRLGGYQSNAWCTCLQYDEESKYAFVGDYSGKISVLKLSENSFEVITTLNGHSGSVRSLSWDEERSLLFSGSFDQSIIVWDIGGKKGSAFELQGHHDKVQALQYLPFSKQLISSGDDKTLVFWDMDVQRKETPEWVNSDTCEKCESPFFWNVRCMWETKKIGVRQHHCRKCGCAVCAKCSQKRSCLPLLGYEHEVRVCDSCHQSLAEDELAPLASTYETKHSVLFVDVDIKKKMLLTVGKDRIIKIWDIGSVLH